MSTKISYSDSDPAYNRAYWTQEIARKGAAAAYQEFKEKDADAPMGRQHFAAHVVGNLIAAAQGPAGITICDSSFGFGCYHGFFAQVIATGGTSLISTLDAACVAAYGKLGTGCQHGIGHGILEYVGYGKVNEALALCKQTTQLVPLLGCTSGVFMEYNFPLSGPADALVPSTRQLDTADRYAPCTSVPADNKDSCYFELGQWTRITLNDYEKVDQFCGGLTGSARRHCYLGVGAIIPPLEGYDAEKNAQICTRFSTSDELACRAGVRWGLYQTPEHRTNADSACAYAQSATRAACLKLGDLTQGQEGN